MALINLCVALAGFNMAATTSVHSTTIPLEPSSGSALIIVPAKVDGKGPFHFIADTGNAGDVIVTPELADKLNLERGSKVKDVYNVGLDTEVTRSTIPSLEVGDFRLGKTKVGISPAISQIAKQLNKPIDGNLGYEFFRNYALTLDMKKMEMTLTQGGQSEGGVDFELVKSMKLVTLSVTVAGKPFTFALDTGASFTCVSQDLVAQLGLKEGQKFPMNNSDHEQGAMTKLPSLSVGGKEVTDFSAVSAGFLKALSERVKTKIDGVLGRNFWSQYRKTIDYPHRKVRFD